MALIGKLKKASIALDHRLLHLFANDSPGAVVILADIAEEVLVFRLGP